MILVAYVLVSWMQVAELCLMDTLTSRDDIITEPAAEIAGSTADIAAATTATSPTTPAADAEPPARALAPETKESAAQETGAAETVSVPTPSAEPTRPVQNDAATNPNDDSTAKLAEMQVLLKTLTGPKNKKQRNRINKKIKELQNEVAGAAISRVHDEGTSPRGSPISPSKRLLDTSRRRSHPEIPRVSDPRVPTSERRLPVRQGSTRVDFNEYLKQRGIPSLDTLQIAGGDVYARDEPQVLPLVVDFCTMLLKIGICSGVYHGCSLTHPL